jgi:hypothetical protein
MTLTPETQRAISELAVDMGLTEAEVVARGVRALAILRATVWTPSPRALAQEAQDPNV